MQALFSNWKTYVDPEKSFRNPVMYKMSHQPSLILFKSSLTWIELKHKNFKIYPFWFSRCFGTDVSAGGFLITFLRGRGGIFLSILYILIVLLLYGFFFSHSNTWVKDLHFMILTSVCLWKTFTDMKTLVILFILLRLALLTTSFLPMRKMYINNVRFDFSKH